MKNCEDIKNSILKIMKSDNISLYELALEIGISYSSLYNLINPRYGISKYVQTKISDYVENYQTKDEKINELKTENKNIIKRLNEFADKFDCLHDYTDVLEVRSEDENGYMYGEEEAIWGDGQTELSKLIRDFTDFVDEVK